MDLLDSAEPRLAERFDTMVESVRVGTVIAHDRKAANRWKSMKGRRVARSGGGGLTGAALERQIGNLAATNPEYVVIETA